MLLLRTSRLHQVLVQDSNLAVWWVSLLPLRSQSEAGHVTVGFLAMVWDGALPSRSQLATVLALDQKPVIMLVMKQQESSPSAVIHAGMEITTCNRLGENAANVAVGDGSCIGLPNVCREFGRGATGAFVVAVDNGACTPVGTEVCTASNYGGNDDCLGSDCTLSFTMVEDGTCGPSICV